jgi:hypothetical protein
MTKTLGDSIFIDFITSNPNTGSVQDADALPTCEVFEDAYDTAIVSPTVVKRTNKTGNYRINIQITDGNGFEMNKSYNVIVSATVNGIASKGVVGSFDVYAIKRPVGVIVTDGSNTASTFKTNLTETTADYHKDSLCLFYTGNLANQVKKVSAYDGGTKFLTVSSAFTGIPSSNDKFILVNI